MATLLRKANRQDDIEEFRQPARSREGRRLANYTAPAFTQTCARPSEQVVAGDFDGDGYTDLVRFAAGNGSMLVAYIAAGGFIVSSQSTPAAARFAHRAQTSQVFVGNFKGGKKGMDITLVDSRYDGTISFAFGVEYQPFVYQDVALPDFAFWAIDVSQPVVGNFGGYGLGAIAAIEGFEGDPDLM